MESIALSVITVSHCDFFGLTRTIASMNSQILSKPNSDPRLVEHIVVASGYDDEEKIALKNMVDNKNVLWIFDKDVSLYNAMNIGLNVAAGSSGFFLNGGDRLFNSFSLDIILKSIDAGEIHLFRVMQVSDRWGYIRPGKKKIQSLLEYSHQGFVVPLDEKTPSFDENIYINADRYWMMECFDQYPATSHDDIVSSFTLGGISNMPSVKTIGIRWRSNGWMRAGLELIKLLLLKTLGPERYYNFLALRKGYEKVSL